MVPSLDPRLPVLVGAGQIAHHGDDLSSAPEPAALMLDALRLAENDSDGSGLLAAADVVGSVGQLSWRYPNVGRLVADGLGATPRRILQSRMGGNLAGSMLNAMARDIQAGRADVVLLCGAEAWRTRNRARAADVTLGWTEQDPGTAEPEMYGPATPLNSDTEKARGVTTATHIYALFDVALRARLGLTVDEHRQRIGGLWSAFSAVAAENPDAWSPQRLDVSELVEPTPINRMIAFPYTKRLCSNNHVDQGAAVILTSVGVAERHGVPRDRWVFLHAGADAVDHWYVSNRADLCSSPAVRVAGREVLALAGIEPHDLAHVDLYSCFPSAVQIAARELGLVDPDATNGTGWGGIGATGPLTVTGGMNFAGGPWNNYPTHGLATMIDVLRNEPDRPGLCTANGGYTTEHALVVLSSRPPAAGAFRHAEPQAEVDALPSVACDDGFEGLVRVESATVVHDRHGPERAIVAARTTAGQRTWCSSIEPEAMMAIETTEIVGRAATRDTEGVFHFV